jgi:protein-S-isoprenylcysteine O-methyltransferase Ste14
MAVIYLGMVGFLAFTIGVGVLGAWLKGHPSKANAEKSSRIAHFLFFAGLVGPGMVTIFYPGLRDLDRLVGLNPLPWRPFTLFSGILLAIPGLYLMAVSNRSLRALGSGANAFRLTKQIVVQDIYRYTRNPMSLGYYLCGLSLGLISGSRYLTLAVLFGLIPAHLFFLKFFEEQELELRFGAAYRQYKQEVPFLLPKRSAE